ncbi:MAG: chorismate synthase [Clostridia bacterium]|nr:chorismate synthase [Clostridia bacterium]
MKNTFGQSLAVTLFGESHGEAVGAVIDGLAPGIPVDKKEIEKLLSKRRPSSALDTARRENDEFSILSGVFEGRTTGTPLCIVIKNTNTKSGDYTYGPARPSHADYAARVKYHGNEDYRGGGHFSGRITAALVAAGGILLPALERKGIIIGTHISQCGNAKDRDFDNVMGDIITLKNADFPVLDESAKGRISDEILRAKNNLDSVGGATQTAIYGLPAGLGEPFFDSVESVLSHALFGIGGIKGVEFGLGFGFARANGSQANDPIRVDNGRVFTETNNNGGINGGITNGMPVVFRCAVKPTPSIAKEQRTVDFIKNENTSITTGGRHDPAIIRRICPVIDSVASIAVCDLLAQRFGTDYLAGEEPVCSSV